MSYIVFSLFAVHNSVIIVLPIDPPATAVSDDIVKVNSTFSTTFNCSSFGIPAPNLYWYFNGGSIESGGVVTVTRSSFINESDLYIRSIELSISEADRASHEGNYTCVAINNVTNLISSLENMTVQLYVQGEREERGREGGRERV